MALADLEDSTLASSSTSVDQSFTALAPDTKPAIVASLAVAGRSPEPECREILSGRLEKVVRDLDDRGNGIDFAEGLQRAKLLHETVSPSSKRGGAPGKRGGGKAKGASVASFVTFVLEHSHISGRTVERFCAIGAGLSEETRDRLRRSGIAWQTTKLEALARLSHEEQARLITEHADKIGKAPELKAKRAVSEAAQAWAAAPEPSPPTVVGLNREYKGLDPVDGEWHKVGDSGIEIRLSEVVTKDGRTLVRRAMRPCPCEPVPAPLSITE